MLYLFDVIWSYYKAIQSIMNFFNLAAVAFCLINVSKCTANESMKCSLLNDGKCFFVSNRILRSFPCVIHGNAPQSAITPT